MSGAHQGVAIVTGAASGIGYALAEAFGAKGAHLLLIDIDGEALESAARSLRDMGHRVEARQADLRDLTALRSAADAAAAIGPVSSLCLNAGVVSTGAPLWETPETAFDLVTGVNLRGLFHSIKAFVPLLLGHDLPSEIVITGSMAGLCGSPGSGVYSASKAAAIAMAKALRWELAPWPRIRVGIINPGLVKTNLVRNSSILAPSAMSSDLASATQAVFDSAATSPQLVARQAMAALDRGQFWILPPEGDPFMQTYLVEADELRDVATSGD